jgi:hypothetical protein
MKVENLTKYTCDACGRYELVGKNESNPMQEYRLPMKYYAENGKQCGLTNSKVDLCSDCAKKLEKILSKHYDICFIAYEGVRMNRRADDEQRD